MFQHFDKYLNVSELIDAAGPSRIFEFGAGGGNNTVKLLGTGAEVVVVTDGVHPENIDPHPRLTWHFEISYKFIPRLSDQSVQFAIIDTDHNAWTLDRELCLLIPKMEKGGLVCIHDTETFKDEDGVMLHYNTGDPYPREEIEKFPLGYRDVIDELTEFGDAYELIRESKESCGAIALRKT